MPKVTFADHGKVCDQDGGRTLLQIALDLEIPITHVCGGDGACGTCRIEVVEGWDALTPPTPDEIYKELEAPFRLSCQCRLRGDAVVKIARIE
ncbi:MAG TPA: 2Fe-2S iron-sulfur cluster-binding protein [Thermoanaerobaculia bacterium]|nr:2Fe-2S iron-sulfur cluster-binding protein [Thermoanaerobaculia bacterium]